MAAQDIEGTEKPVREQLKKASIGGLSEEARAAAYEARNAAGQSTENKQATVVEGDETPLDMEISNAETGEKRDAEPAIKPVRYHTRKRSRDSTAEDDELNEHKRKISGERSRAQSPAAESAATNGSAKHKASDRSSTPDPTTSKNEAAGETVVSPKVKRSKIQEETGSADNDSKSTGKATKIPAGSGFANTSATSPFGALANNKPSTESDQPQTSSSAFAASGFSSLASSAASPFATAGKMSGGFGSGGGFGPSSKSPLGASANEENAKPSGSAFGGSLGQQSAFGAPKASLGGFGSGASGFGKIGQSSALGSGLGGSGFGSGATGLTSFASGKSTPLSGATKAKPAFGAPADDDDDDEYENDGADDDAAAAAAGSKSPLAAEEDAKDERFFEQDVETGEEDETTAYSCRAKLYNYFTLPDGKKEWRERGLGVLRLNVKPGEDGDESGRPKARFLMRADGSHRVVLNTPIKKEIKFGTPSGAPPTNGFMYFLGTFDGRDNLEMLQIKVSQYSTRDTLTSKLTMNFSSANNSPWNSTRRSSICKRRCRISAVPLRKC